MLYAALSTGVRAGVNLILLPILVKQLTTSELALWWVFVSLGGLAGLADFGFGQAITRVYSYLWAGVQDFEVEGLHPPPSGAKPNQPRLRRFNATVCRLYLWLSLGSLVVLTLGGTVFLWGSAQTAPAPGTFWVIWGLYVMTVVYGFGSSHWTLACQGLDRVRDLQLAYLWSSLAYFFAAAAMLLAGCGLWAMVVASAVRGVLTRQICVSAYRRFVPKVKGEHTRADLVMLRKIWPNAWKFGLLSVAVYLINNGAVLVCSRYLGDEVTASYGLTSQLGLFLVSFSALWLTVKWPQITILRTQGRVREMAILFARRLALVMITFAAGAVLLLLLGNRLLEWKGSHTRLLALPYLVVYLLYLWQQLFYGQFGSLTFTENVVPFYRLAFCTGLGMITLSLLLTPQYGLWGLILAPVIAAQVGNSWYPIWLGFRGQPLSVREFLHAAIWGRVGPDHERRNQAGSAV